jgi:hypothetical protein
MTGKGVDRGKRTKVAGKAPRRLPSARRSGPCVARLRARRKQRVPLFKSAASR